MKCLPLPKPGPNFQVSQLFINFNKLSYEVTRNSLLILYYLMSFLRHNKL